MVESNGVNGYSTLAANNQTTGAQTKNEFPPPPKGYTRIWIEVRSNVAKGRDGKVLLPDTEIERGLFNRFGMRSETEADLLKLKERLGTTDNPFDNVRTSVGGRINHRADGVYRIPVDVKNSLYTKLSGKAAQVKKEIEQSKPVSGSNPNESIAARNGIDRSKLEQARLAQLIRDAEVDSTSFGIPNKLTDMTHVIIALPAGVEPNADSALSAYIERLYGGGNLYGPDKLDILSNAKSNGVKVENLKIDPNNNRVVEFDISLENRLILRKAYLDVQEKVNSDIAISDKARDEMAINQFLLGVMQGAYDDVAGNIHTITHPLETLQGIRDAINILSKSSAADLKNIAAELGNKAANATPGQAAHAAGYVVGTAVVEILLAKGAGVAISALGKTRAGAEFLARIGKLTEKVGEVANLGKAKIAEMFSNEAATLAKQRLMQSGSALALLPGAIPPELFVIAGNKLKNGAIKFADFSKQMINEFGEAVKPHLEKLYRDSLISLDLSKAKPILSAGGRTIDEAVVREAKEKVIQFVQENKVKELKEYLGEISNRYGTEFESELKKTVENTVDNIHEGRRTPELHDMLGGHTIYDLFDSQIDTKHIGKTVEQLRDRLKREVGIRYASTFKDLDTANRAQMQFIRHFEKEIAEWLKNGASGTFTKTLETGQNLGTVVGRGKIGVKIGTSFEVTLAKDGTNQGWHIVTSYPTLP